MPLPPGRLQLQQGGKPSAAADELLGWPFFHDLTRFHHQDPIGFLRGGQAMGHREHGAATAQDRGL